ncbi:MAG: DUF4175 family protein, partial [Planctomycetota bacterium]
MSSTILSQENVLVPEVVLDLEQQQSKLVQDVAKVAEDARQTLWRRALFIWFSILVLTGLVLVCVDIGLKQEDAIFRWLLFFSFLSIAAVTAWRILGPAKRFEPDVQSVANWIEQSDLSNAEQLATTIRLSLLSGKDTNCGGHEFRSMATANWFQRQQQPDWSGMVDRSPARRSLVALALSILLTAIFVAISPGVSTLGFARLFAPFLELPWPRADRLELVDLPSAVAYGSELQIEIRDANSPLPAAIDVFVREEVAGGTLGEVRVYAANTFGEVAVASIPRVENPLEVRAAGGDDDSMPWRRIDVVRPPEIAEHRFRTVAPEYARIADGASEKSQLSVLQGSRVELTGRFDGQVAKLEVVPMSSKGSSRNDSDDRPSNNVACELDGLDFALGRSTPWVATESLRWQFRVHTRDGLQVNLPRTWTVDVIQDRMPAILLESPALSSVSRDAQLRVRGEVSDDLGLVEVKVILGFAATADEETLMAAMQILHEQTLAADLDQLAEPVKQYSIRSAVDLSAIDIAEDQEFRFWLEARDSLGQIARSSPQAFRIRSAEQVLEAIE